jgi:acetolactate synthase-1/2/3 large subunit
MKVTDYLVRFFEQHGVKVIFGYQGGMITHFVDSISKSENIRFIQTYHEQSAAIAAEGYARESGGIGVAISTSGPGATNMITGIANAFFDSIPVIYITGQVNTYEYKYRKRIRQQGFQETDIVSMVKPITKYAVMVSDPRKVQSEFEKAVSIALSGRKGPVLIDLPMDVQRADIDIQNIKKYYKKRQIYLRNNTKDFKRAWGIFCSAKRPLVLCGGGISNADCSSAVNKFLERTKLPFIVSLMGKGCVDETLNNFIGMIGSYGNRDANIVFSQSDVILVLGSRLDLRQTGNQNSDVLKQIKFIHIDIDIQELKESKLQNCLNILGDISDFIESVRVFKQEVSINAAWTDFISWTKGKYNQEHELNRFVENKAPYQCIDAIQNRSVLNTIYTIDIGQNQMWSSQRLRLKKGDAFYTSGGLAPMGYALHSAIGAAFASPEKQVVCIIGDGGFHMAIQSLMLISQYDLKISVCVINNHALGMITQFQELYFNSNMVGTTKTGGYIVPNIESIAKAFTLHYVSCDKDDYQNIEVQKYNIVEFSLSGQTKVSPKLEYNQPLYNMIPYLDKNEIKEIILKVKK